MTTTDGNNSSLNEVRTIFRGPETGDSMRAQNLYAREAKSLDCVQFVNMTKHAATFAKMENIAITFTEEEARKLLQPHNDAIVVSLQVANSLVHWILIDNGSSADILFKDALTKINLGGAKLIPVNTPLQGFSRVCIHTEGMITLPVTLGEGDTKVTRMVNFFVVDQPFAYNAIIGQPTLNAMRVITSTYHLMMKFPAKNGDGLVVGSQHDARICYVKITNWKVESKGREV